MNKKIFVIGFSALICAAGGNLLAEPGHHDHQHHQHHHSASEKGHSEGGHHHGTLVLSDDQPIPQVDLVVHQDTVRGWNLEIKLENFELAPERVNQANQPNEGHAHLFVNGEKITRIYSDWYYLPELPPGENTIKISLNTNSHEFLEFAGKTIEDTAIVMVE